MSQLIQRIWYGEDGASLVEYGLLVALIVAVGAATATVIATSWISKN